MLSIASWKGCNGLNFVVVRVVHEAESCIAVNPYHLAFLAFDLMERSGIEEIPATKDGT
jgi:hypothetical protein